MARSSHPTPRRRCARIRKCSWPTSGAIDMAHPELIVDARAVHAWYGSSHVLHGIDLQIARGETVGLLGRNGMGKSTLIRTLLGHVTQRNGHISLFGQDCSRARPRRATWCGLGLATAGLHVGQAQAGPVVGPGPGLRARRPW